MINATIPMIITINGEELDSFDYTASDPSETELSATGAAVFSPSITTVVSIPD